MGRSWGGPDRESTDGDLLVVAALARQAAAPMTPLQRMRGLEAVNRRGEARQRKRRSLAVGAGLSACGLVAAGVVGLFVVRGSSRVMAPVEASPISYQVERGEIGDGGYLRAFSSEHDREREREPDGVRGGVGLRFAEGSELRLAAGARGRLTSVDAQGARFAIEQGEALVSVTPRPGARWLIDAGPFLITVQGTRFSAAWDGATERLDVRMEHGLVSVTGPVANGKIAVRAGQRLTINVQQREVLLRPTEDSADNTAGGAGALPAGGAGALPAGGAGALPAGGAGALPADESAAGAAAAPAGTTSAALVPAEPLARHRSASAARIAPARPAAAGSDGARGRAGTGSGTLLALRERGWTAALAAGDFHTILDEAQHRGWHRALGEARSEDLAALADAARYLRRDDLARQALIAQRDRFPRTDRAHEAAFLLGRLSETGSDGDVRALIWYDRYLEEAPRGAYAAEAMGRKMTATEKLKGLTAAQEIAREYLHRFPHGTYAGAARALASTP